MCFSTGVLLKKKMDDVDISDSGGVSFSAGLCVFLRMRETASSHQPASLFDTGQVLNLQETQETNS